MKFWVPVTSKSLRYSKFTKNYQFQFLRFFHLGVKLGFEFPGVTPNQKYQPRSLNLNFDEENNPMLGSLKNSSSENSPNFLHQKLKNAQNQIPLRQKDAPFNREFTQPPFVDDLWRETQKVRILASAVVQCLILRLALIPCYIFII